MFFLVGYLLYFYVRVLQVNRQNLQVDNFHWKVYCEPLLFK